MTTTTEKTLPAEITIQLPKDAGEFTIDVTALSDDTVAHLVAFGLREKANNAASGKAGTEAIAALEAIQRNEWRAGGGGRRLDPMIRAWRQVLEGRLPNGAAGRKVRTWADVSAACRDLAIIVISRRDKVKPAEAAKRVDDTGADKVLQQHLYKKEVMPLVEAWQDVDDLGDLLGGES